MMTMATTALITSRDPKGQQATSIFEAAYNKSKLDDERAQCLNENGDELKEGILRLIAQLSVPNQFADEEVESKWAYPQEYAGPKPIDEQIEMIAKLFSLSTGATLEYVDKVLPTWTPQEGAEGPFALPRWQKIGKTYSEAVERVLAMVKASRTFHNYREGNLGPQYLRELARTIAMWQRVSEVQKGDILVVPAQFGLRHRGKSVRRAREVFTANEFGLGAFAVMSMLLTHPDREIRWEQLHVDCSGDEYSPGAVGKFENAPCVDWFDGELEFFALWVSGAGGHFGAASAFIPQ
jgi:hypothetical protein